MKEAGVDDVTTRRSGLLLLAASFVILFQEMVLIRWLPGQVRVLAYFPNLILISAFLGLGVGCLRAGRRNLLWTWPVSLLAVVGTALALARVVFTQNSPSEHLFLLYYDLPRDALTVADVRPPILAFFVLSALSFVGLGQFVAERFAEMGRRGQTLLGYRYDIAGSILGVAGFTLASFWGTFPMTWFCLLALAGIPLALPRHARRTAALLAACSLAVLALVHLGERAERYSPYYALRVVPEGSGVSVLTNGSLHQTALPMRRSAPLLGGEDATRTGYHEPYRILGRPPRRALVVGAGTGNDVAVLLDEGAESIDAVEIDPEILAIGRARHPDSPYASSRVNPVVSDARTFLQNTRQQYDVIVFGTLDSMTRLSALSTVRLDNFVYTEDCLRAARARLTPDGALVLYFMSGQHYIDQRLGGMLTRVFEQAPLVDDTNRALFNRAYMAGPGFDHRDGPARRATAAQVMAKVEAATELPSDDWPFLYVQERGIPDFYRGIMAVLAALAVGGVLLASPDLRRRRGGADGEMLLLGAGFLLLETRSVTQMNLAWGATWLTSAVVFVCVLLMVFLSAVAVQRGLLSEKASRIGVVAALLLAWAAPPSVLLASAPALRFAVSLAVAGLPVFFGSSCFAHAFARRPLPELALGWNLMGSVLGGLLETAGMAVGLRALLLVALAAYVVSFVLPASRTSLSPEAETA